MSGIVAHRPRDELEPKLARYQDELSNAAAVGPDQYRRVFEKPPPGIGAHEIDLNKIYTRVNQGALQILGYEAEDLIGTPVTNIVVLTDLSAKSIERKLVGQLPLKTFVRTFIGKDRRSVPLLLLDRHIEDARGQVVGIRTVFAPVQLGG